MKAILHAQLAKLLAIGSLAGLFSGLLGVGGGVLIVPLLTLWLQIPARKAAGTSLAAILVIASFGAIGNGFLGNVDLSAAVIIGFSAAVGTSIGATLAQKVDQRFIAVLFSIVAVGCAIALVVS